MVNPFISLYSGINKDVFKTFIVIMIKDKKLNKTQVNPFFVKLLKRI